MPTMSSSKLHIAVEGCCHGELDRIFTLITDARRNRGRQVDLLLVCGDFQGVRNSSDLQCLAVPEKYRSLNSFHEYVNGTKVAPVLTIIIGGNHEASNILQNLYYGGWIAPNIYFLGYAGVVCINDSIKIGGLSGIYNAGHYHNTHYEVPPYSPDALRSVYHVRELEIFRLAQYTSLLPQSPEAVCGTSGYRRSPIDIFLSHDWPQHIWEYGDLNYLLKVKPYFRQDIETHQLGNPPLMQQVLRRLRPRYWFAAHLHVKFAAVVTHVGDATQGNAPLPGKRRFGDLTAVNVNTSGSFDTIFDDEDGDAVGTDAPAVYCGEIGRSARSHPSGPNMTTRFLALDKIQGGGRGGGRFDRGGFLQFMTVPVTKGRRRQLLSALGQDPDPDWEAAAQCLPQGAKCMQPPADNNEIDISMDEEEDLSAGEEALAAAAPPPAADSFRPPLPPGAPPTASKPVTLSYDLEWLAIIRKTHHLLSSEDATPATMHQVSGVNTQRRVRMPTQFPLVTDDDIEQVHRRFVECRGGSLVIPPLEVLSPTHAAPSVPGAGPAVAEDNSLPLAFASSHRGGGGKHGAKARNRSEQPRPKPPQAARDIGDSYYGPTLVCAEAEYEQGNRQTDELLELLQLPHIWTRRCPVAVVAASTATGSKPAKRPLVPSQVLHRRAAGPDPVVSAAGLNLACGLVSDDNELDIDDL